MRPFQMHHVDATEHETVAMQHASNASIDDLNSSKHPTLVYNGREMVAVEAFDETAVEPVAVASEYHSKL